MNKSSHSASKYLPIDTLVETIKQLRKNGRSIALCHGVFDLVHPGHIQHFNSAKNLADILIVSITEDKFVNKGPGRPLFSQDIRAESLAALTDIDFVVLSENTTAIEIINQIKPDLYIKGSDYLNSSDDVTGKIVDEKSAVEKFGGKLHFTNEITSSSSSIINRFFSNIPNEAQNWVKKFKENQGLELSFAWLEKIQSLNLLVAGESIIDRYTSCNPLAKSSKDPILAFQIDSTKSYPGGVLAIANNCSNWVSGVSVISNIGRNPEEYELLRSSLNEKIRLNLIESKDRPNILKHRYVDSNSNTRVFEYYDFDPLAFDAKTNNKIIEKFKLEIEASDAVIIADYGHGFFTDDIIKTAQSSDKFLAVNTQANAGNRGYNTISKYGRADLICLNSAEIQLELRTKKLDFQMIIPKLLAKMGAKYGVVTLGSEGLIVFDNKNSFAHVPALATSVVDKVGAGDAVLAMASSLSCIGAPVEIIGFLCNVVAAHEVSQLGHQTSLTTADIKKHVKALLG